MKTIEEVKAYCMKHYNDGLDVINEERAAAEYFSGENEIKVNYHYCVYGLSYNKNNRILDYERDFGTFDTEEEAKEKYEEAIREAEDNLDDFFLDKEPEVHYWTIQIEKCIEDEEGIHCIDILAEHNVYHEEWFDESILYDDYGIPDEEDYSPSAPWNAPGMSISDFITGVSYF